MREIPRKGVVIALVLCFAQGFVHYSQTRERARRTRRARAVGRLDPRVRLRSTSGQTDVRTRLLVRALPVMQGVGYHPDKKEKESKRTCEPPGPDDWVT